MDLGQFHTYLLHQGLTETNVKRLVEEDVASPETLVALSDTDVRDLGFTVGQRATVRRIQADLSAQARYRQAATEYVSIKQALESKDDVTEKVVPQSQEGFETAQVGPQEEEEDLSDTWQDEFDDVTEEDKNNNEEISSESIYANVPEHTLAQDDNITSPDGTADSIDEENIYQQDLYPLWNTENTSMPGSEVEVTQKQEVEPQPAGNLQYPYDPGFQNAPDVGRVDSMSRWTANRQVPPAESETDNLSQRHIFGPQTRPQEVGRPVGPHLIRDDRPLTQASNTRPLTRGPNLSHSFEKERSWIRDQNTGPLSKGPNLSQSRPFEKERSWIRDQNTGPLSQGPNLSHSVEKERSWIRDQNTGPLSQGPVLDHQGRSWTQPSNVGPLAQASNMGPVAQGTNMSYFDDRDRSWTQASKMKPMAQNPNRGYPVERERPWGQASNTRPPKHDPNQGHNVGNEELRTQVSKFGPIKHNTAVGGSSRWEPAHVPSTVQKHGAPRKPPKGVTFAPEINVSEGPEDEYDVIEDDEDDIPDTLAPGIPTNVRVEISVAVTDEQEAYDVIEDEDDEYLTPAEKQPAVKRAPTHNEDEPPAIPGRHPNSALGKPTVEPGHHDNRSLSPSRRTPSPSRRTPSPANSGSRTPSPVLRRPTADATGKKTTAHKKSQNRMSRHQINLDIASIKDGHKGKFVAELSTISTDVIDPLPVRIVFLVDISGSMSIKTGRRRRSKLRHFKDFIQNMITCLDDGDVAGLVVFGEEAKTLMPLSVISDDSRGRLMSQLSIIDHVMYSIKTDLSAGLNQALQELSHVCKNVDDLVQWRNAIIIFSDGEINAGVTHVGKLVHETREKIRAMSMGLDDTQNQWVSIATVVTGNATAEQLYALSRFCSSDAFYHVNMNKEESEVDLFLPVMLRKLAIVWNVWVHFESLNGATIINSECTQENKARLQKNAKIDENSRTEKAFFFYDISASTSKHIGMALDLSHVDMNPATEILEVELIYSSKHSPREREVKIITVADLDPTDHYKIKRALELNYMHEARIKSMNVLNQAADNVKEGHVTDSQNNFSEGESELQKLMRSYGERASEAHVSLNIHEYAAAVADNLQNLLTSVSTALGDEASGENWSKIKAVSSAISREAPNVSNVVSSQSLLCPLPDVKEVKSDRIRSEMERLYTTQGVSQVRFSTFDDVLYELNKTISH